ncbi:MAG: hypothetical protein V4612_07570 [Pseudomonadota bacterium]
MKKIIVLISFIFLCSFISSGKLNENKIREMIGKIEKTGIGYKNVGSVANTNIELNNRLSKETFEEMKKYKTTEVEGVYRLGQLLTCKNELDLSFFYGETKEMNRLIAIYFLLTKEPPTPDNFEPKSLIYIKAQGKIKTNESRSGNIEGVFFLTKLLEYSSDKEVIQKCKQQNKW